jgi:putative phosphoribosyl transferase
MTPYILKVTAGTMLNFGYWNAKTATIGQAQNELCMLVGKFAQLQSAKKVLDVGSGFSAPAIFEAIAGKLHFRFKDRITAAGILAESLKDKMSTEERKSAIVLAIPRGGVVTGDIVARKLSCRLGVIIPRKLTDPDNKEYAIGAIMEDGTTYIDQEAVNHLQISPEYLEQEKLHQIEEIKRRKSLFLGSREDDLNDKTVILVDDGAATGATIIVAARSIRKQFRPKRLIHYLSHPRIR